MHAVRITVHAGIVCQEQTSSFASRFPEHNLSGTSCISSKISLLFHIFDRIYFGQ
uniref:Uncharacterized protein n=1 Tax=Arundo donax TaxID=35708 RepID=A0A0A9BLB1_ARUDO